MHDTTTQRPVIINLKLYQISSYSHSIHTNLFSVSKSSEHWTSLDFPRENILATFSFPLLLWSKKINNPARLQNIQDSRAVSDLNMGTLAGTLALCLFSSDCEQEPDEFNPVTIVMNGSRYLLKIKIKKFNGIFPHLTGLSGG